jgi:hypothetical protein
LKVALRYHKPNQTINGILPAKVPHVIYNTQLHPFKITGISARHLVAKAEIEGYMRQIGLPLTFIMIPCLYEDLFSVLKPIDCGRGLYEIGTQLGQ